MASCRHEKVYRIGVSQCSSDDWREKMNGEIEREIMFHTNASVEIRSADDSPERQIEDIRYFADSGFDIIVASPVEAVAITPVIEEVYSRGIPVMIFDRNITGDSYTARIGVDNIGLGRMAAEYALRMFQGRTPKAIEIFGRDGSTPAADRHTGFAGTFTAGGGILAGSASADWKKEEAMPKVDSLLRLYPDVDLIYAHNDRMAIGASEVARSHGLDSIRIIGIDAAPDIGIRAVADSVIDATFLYPTEGQTLIRTALDIVQGRPYSRETMLPHSGVVDRSNADILLLQNRYLREETDKMKILKNRIDAYWESHSAQTSLFYAVIAITLLLIVVLFLLWRAYWQRREHQSVLMKKNRQLEQERDKQKDLNEQLSAATRSRLVFFTNVSHDLRTPLTLISEPLDRLAAARLAPEQDSMVALARKNVRILMRLINQILDFRKYDSGKLELGLTEVDFFSILADWIDSFRPVALSRQIHVCTEIPADSCPLALDVEKIERVFFNLMSNAIKHTSANGTITVRALRRDNLVFELEDTGCGIAPEELEKIFENFYQIDKIHPKGSGIGLWLSRAFVELHGGTLKVSSTPGRGSTFTVAIPVRHVSDKTENVAPAISAAAVSDELCVAEVPDTENAPDDDRPRVLIIDDNSDMLSFVGGILGGEYRILRATNGRDGVRLAAKYVPDLIVCDVMMPVMDGNECCRRIKAELCTSHIPVLMLTACSMDSQRIEGYSSGVDAYLSKPFSSEVLLARCKALIENRKRIYEIWRSAKPAETAAGLVKGGMPRSDIDNEFYQRFLDVFESEMANAEISVDFIAGRLGLERSQFYRKIKSLTNYSPVELMRRLRLRRAHSLLAASEKSISEIAYEVGFSSPAYFTKCYREAYGETPTQARERLGR